MKVVIFGEPEEHTTIVFVISEEAPLETLYQQVCKFKSSAEKFDVIVWLVFAPDGSVMFIIGRRVSIEKFTADEFCNPFVSLCKISGQKLLLFLRVGRI